MKAFFFLNPEMQQHQEFFVSERQIKLRIDFLHKNPLFVCFCFFNEQLSRVFEKVPGFKEIRVLGFRWAGCETHISYSFLLNLPIRINRLSEHSVMGYQDSYFAVCCLLCPSAWRMCLYVMPWSSMEKPSLVLIPKFLRSLMRKRTRTQMARNWSTLLSRP